LARAWAEKVVLFGWVVRIEGEFRAALFCVGGGYLRRFYALVSTWSWGWAFFYPVSLLFCYQRAVTFCTVAYVFSGSVLCQYFLNGNVSFLLTIFNLLIKPLLAAPECF